MDALVCVPKVSQGCETKKHTQTLTLRIFQQFITIAHKLQTPNLALLSKGDTALPTLPKPHYPLPHTKLASLVKDEVLSPEKIWATTGGIVPP